MSAIPENQSRTVFDGASEMRSVSKPISAERALELDAILGKALIERFKKEEEKLAKSRLSGKED